MAKTVETPLGLELSKTARGFALYEFADACGEFCTLQESSSAGEEREIWFGPEGRVQAFHPQTGWYDVELPPDPLVHSRMLLTQSMVRELLPVLTRFAETGELS